MMIKRILAALAALLLVAIAILAGQHAFERVLDFRKLERIPLGTVIASTGGEVQLRGRVEPMHEPVLSPDTKTPAVYYYYKVEEERKDSDGNKSWRTVHESREAVDFYLDDTSGRALVRADAALQRVDWSVARKFRERRGDRRYSEWRIDVGDQVTLFGWLELKDPEPEVSFHAAGDYLPIVSSFGAQEERSDMGWWSIVLLAVAVSALSFASFFLAYSLAIHRILVFLFIVAFSSGLLLLHYGWQSLESDVNAGHQRYLTQLERSSQLIDEAFQQHGIQWRPGEVFDLNEPKFSRLSAAERQGLNGWRMASFQVRERYLRQISKFPENLYARIQGLDAPPVLPMPADQLAQAQAAANEFQPTRIGKHLIFIVLGLVITAAAAWFAFRFIRIKRIQENLPSCKTSGVVFGLSEVTGTLEPEDPNHLLTGPLSNERCSWFHYKVMERRGSGKNQRWVTIEDRTEKQPFYCRDDEGRIRVFPNKAEVISHQTSRKRIGKRLYKEWRLQPEDKLYLLGKAAIDKTCGDALVLVHDKDNPFIISNRPEKAVMLMKAARGMLILSAAVSVMFISLLLLAGGNGSFSSLDFLLAALAAPAFLVVLMVIIMYNDLVFLRQRCHRAWANIQVSLKKRSDLVPRLQSVAERYLAHEKDLQKELAEMRQLRNQSGSAAAVDSYMAVEHKLLDRLQVVVERYPDLRGNEVLASLHRRLVKLENEVAMMRSGFNDAVLYYNTRIQQFPDNLLARIFAFKLLSVLQFDKAAHAIPELKPSSTKTNFSNHSSVRS